MKGMIVTLSIAAALALTSCMNNNPAHQEKKALDSQARQEKRMVSEAICDRSPDFQQVEIVGNSVVYTHIFDGIIDVKTYTYYGDQCVEAERVYAFPDQMSALRHYRRAIEHAQLYDDIQLVRNEVRYNLKEAQHELETKGLTKEQLKTKFEDQLKAARADFEKGKKDCKDCKPNN